MLATKSGIIKILKNKEIDPVNRHGINLKEYLPLFLKKNSKISQDLLDSLNLDLANDKLDELHKRYDGGCAFRYDATFYFILWYTYKKYKTGICLLGFKIRGDKLLIVQIQGLRIDYDLFSDRKEDVKKTIKPIMSSLKWERLLVKVVEDWARKMDFKKIGILQAKHNEYFVNETEAIDWQITRNDRLKMHYDVTAERMGYRKKLRSKYRFKNLPKT